MSEDVPIVIPPLTPAEVECLGDVIIGALRLRGGTAIPHFALIIMEPGMTSSLVTTEKKIAGPLLLKIAKVWCADGVEPATQTRN